MIINDFFPLGHAVRGPRPAVSQARSNTLSDVGEIWMMVSFYSVIYVGIEWFTGNTREASSLVIKYP